MDVSSQWMPVPFQSGKIIFVGRGSKRRLNPSLSEIRVSTTFRSDMPLESGGSGQNTDVGRRGFIEGESDALWIKSWQAEAHVCWKCISSTPLGFPLSF